MASPEALGRRPLLTALLALPLAAKESPECNSHTSSPPPAPLIQVSEELIRVAILWHEMWHEGLEEASRLYFGERNVKGMFEVLEPLHAMMERGPQTLKETSFNQVGGGWTQGYHQGFHQPAFL